MPPAASLRPTSLSTTSCSQPRRQLRRQHHAISEAATTALSRIRAHHETTIARLEDAVQVANARLASRRRRLAVTVGLTLLVLVLLLTTVTHGTAQVIAALWIAAGILAILLARRAVRNHKEPRMLPSSRWQTPSYAEGLHRLETIQQQLADADSPESVTALITEATELRRHCQDILGRSEQTVASQR